MMTTTEKLAKIELLEREVTSLSGCMSLRCECGEYITRMLIRQKDRLLSDLGKETWTKWKGAASATTNTTNAG